MSKPIIFGKGLKLLLTGPPGVGKSTLLSSILERLTCCSGGILCLEERDEEGKRKGFQAEICGGERYSFMSKIPVKDMDLPSKYARVGNYAVDLEVIKDHLVAELERCLTTSPELIYIDELGRAQAHSFDYLQAAKKIFQSDCNIIATIVEQDVDWSLEFKYSPDAWLVRVSTENRMELSLILLSLIKNYHLFERLNSSQKLKTRQLFFELLESNKFVSARKLFENSLLYVLDSRIKKISESTVESTFHILGTTGSHVLLRDNVTNTVSCDCDLFNRIGKFRNLTAESAICSHQLSIILWELCCDL